MTNLDLIKEVFDIELDSIKKFRDSLDESVVSFIDELGTCRGTIVFTGVGKSGHVCKKIVATMQSLGIKSVYLHPVEAMHGDLGYLSRDDIVVLVSNSGETKEILDIIPSINRIGSRLFSIVGRSGSSLEKLSEKIIVMNGIKEAYLDGMVPSSSTTATMVLGDAIAIAIAKRNKFSKEQFSIFHPSGQLGKKMTLRVSDMMIKGNEVPIVLSGSTLEQVIFEMCKKSVGGVCVVDRENSLVGVITDGDIRRIVNRKHLDWGSLLADDLMSKNPISVNENILLYDMVTDIIPLHEFSFYPVVDMKKRVCGTVRMVDIVKSGLMKV